MEMLELMRRGREERRLDLLALEQRTRVRSHLLSAVEDGRFDELPRGVYARAVVRAYASAVGIDPNRAVTALSPYLPEAEDALDGIARVRGFERRTEPAAARPAQDTPAALEPAAHVPLAAAEPRAPHRKHALQDASYLARQAAAAIDGLVLGCIGFVLLALTARTAGVSIPALLQFATPALLMLFVLIAGLYFLLLGGILGTTAGTHLMHLARTAAPAAGGVHAVWRRASGVAARELSILVDVLLVILSARTAGGTPEGPRSETPWEDRAPAR